MGKSTELTFTGRNGAGRLLPSCFKRRSLGPAAVAQPSDTNTILRFVFVYPEGIPPPPFCNTFVKIGAVAVVVAVVGGVVERGESERERERRRKRDRERERGERERERERNINRV